MKFLLFTEGFTEKKALPEFLKRWLDPQLKQKAGIKVVRFNGCGQYLEDVAMKAKMHLNGSDGGDIIAVIGLLDLYGPTFYPTEKTTAQDRYDWAKKKIEKAVDHVKFRQHFAVHECEAWLLSDPAGFPTAVKRALKPVQCAQPETVNFNQPPKKLLNKLYGELTGRNYKEVTHGAELFGKLDPDVPYAKCPRLQAMLDDMLALAKAAGL